MLKFKHYEWIPGNILHIARHGITPNEVEEACFNKHVAFKTREGRYFVVGKSDAGRYLAVVLEAKQGQVARPITARDMNYKERKLYMRKEKL